MTNPRKPSKEELENLYRCVVKGILMKYITEADLRFIPHHPFTTYETEPGTRLTPGARQFLGTVESGSDEYLLAKKFGTGNGQAGTSGERRK